MWQLPRLGESGSLHMLPRNWGSIKQTHWSSHQWWMPRSTTMIHTHYSGFHAVFINRWLLQFAWYQYKQQYKATYDGRKDKLFWHMAYKQLTLWCWGILGKEIRVVPSACAVKCIRNSFTPPEREEAFVFEGFQYTDEWLCLPQLSKAILISLENHDTVFFVCAYVNGP